MFCKTDLLPLFKAGAEKLIRLFKLRLVGQCDGIANSKEKKYINQIKGDKIIVNTLCKMAQKRSLVGAVLIVCGASEYFVQDLED